MIREYSRTLRFQLLPQCKRPDHQICTVDSNKEILRRKILSGHSSLFHLPIPEVCSSSYERIILIQSFRSHFALYDLHSLWRLCLMFPLNTLNFLKD